MPPKSDKVTSRVTLRDIGKAVGVSHVTVSLVLRNHPRISDAVRRKVLQAVAEMGYRPDPMLAALANYRKGITPAQVSASIVWINGWEDPARLRTFREFDGYWRGAFEAAERWGYRLEELVVQPRLSVKRLRSILRARGVRGILLPPQFDTIDWSDFPWEEFSIVRFGRSLPCPRAHLVTSDHVRDSLCALSRMRELGYERIGFVSWAGEPGEWVRRPQFLAGFLVAQYRFPEESRIPPLLLTHSDLKENIEALRQWLTVHRPDSILTEVAETKSMLRSLRLRVPEDIGVAATSVLDGNADAGIFQNPTAIGKVAAELLIALMSRNECGVPEVCHATHVEGEWRDGSTLPPRKR